MAIGVPIPPRPCTDPNRDRNGAAQSQRWCCVIAQAHSASRVCSVLPHVGGSPGPTAPPQAPTTASSAGTVEVPGQEVNPARGVPSSCADFRTPAVRAGWRRTGGVDWGPGARRRGCMSRAGGRASSGTEWARGVRVSPPSRRAAFGQARSPRETRCRRSEPSRHRSGSGSGRLSTPVVRVCRHAFRKFVPSRSPNGSSHTQCRSPRPMCGLPGTPAFEPLDPAAESFNQDHAMRKPGCHAQARHRRAPACYGDARTRRLKGMAALRLAMPPAPERGYSVGVGLLGPRLAPLVLISTARCHGSQCHTHAPCHSRGGRRFLCGTCAQVLYLQVLTPRLLTEDSAEAGVPRVAPDCRRPRSAR